MREKGDRLEEEVRYAIILVLVMVAMAGANGPQLTQEYNADQLNGSIDQKDNILLPGRIGITEEVNLLQEPHSFYVTDTLQRTEEISICDFCNDSDIVEHWKYRVGCGNKFPLFASSYFKICGPCAKKALSVVMGDVAVRMRIDPQFRAKHEGGVSIGNWTPEYLATIESYGNLYLQLNRDWGTREIVFETDGAKYRFTRDELVKMLENREYRVTVDRR